jgi:predicted nucleotidyltransferase
LFGSVARDEAGAGSDIDVGVLCRRRGAGPADLEFVESLRGVLEDQLRSEVDVVVLDDAPADLVHRVLRDGVLLAECDSRARIEFEVAARNEYFDLLPILEMYRRTVLDGV